MERTTEGRTHERAGVAPGSAVAQVSRRYKIGYAIGWLMASVVFAGIYAAARSTSPVQLVLLPVLLGAIWPLSVPALILFLASG